MRIGESSSFKFISSIILLTSMAFLNVSCGLALLTKVEVQPPYKANTYSCNQCLCKMFTTGWPPLPDDYEFVYNGVTTCADNEVEAKAFLMQACSLNVSQMNRGSGFLSSSPEVRSCRPDVVKLETEGVCSNKLKIPLISAKPSNSSFDGPVDFGLSYLYIRVPSQNDIIRAKIKGTVAIVGGNCPDQDCPIEIWYAHFTPIEKSLKSEKGLSLLDMIAFNHGIWRGNKYRDGSLKFDTDAFISLSGITEGAQHLLVMKAADFIQGKILKGTRLKNSGPGSEDNIAFPC